MSDMTARWFCATHQFRSSRMLFTLLAATWLALATTASATPQTGAQASPAQGVDKTVETQPIRSRAALDAYLRHSAETGAVTPFDALSPGARIRFIGSLEFGSRGLTSFSSDDLSRELDASQLGPLFALFGEPGFARLVHLPPANAQHKPPAASRSAAISDLEQRYNRFYTQNAPRRDETDLQASDRLHRMFDALFPEAADPAAIIRLDDHDLPLLLRAATAASFWTTSSQAATTMDIAVRAMQTRGIATKTDLVGVYRSLVTARRFAQARRFASDHPKAQLEPLPTLHDDVATDDGRPTVWVLGHNDNDLTRTAVNLQPVQILVIAGCHFSEDAARSIATDPVLGPVFRDHARWLMLPPGQESINDVREWNRKYPDAQVALVHDRNEWPILGRWVMPTYVIVKGGKVLDSASGWPPNPDRQHLVNMLAHAGLLPAGKQ